MKDESERIDEALATWPAKDLDWESAAERVKARIESNLPAKSKTRLSDDDLFAPPLPESEEDETLLKSAVSSTAGLTAGMENSKNSTRGDVPSGSFESIDAPSSGRGKAPESRRAPNSGPLSSAPARSSRPEAMEAKMGTQAVRQRERSSFKDLAEMAATPPPSSNAYNLPSGPLSVPASSKQPSSSHMPAAPSSAASKDPNDSGLVDLQMVAAADPHGAERSKTTALASAGLFDEEPGSIPPSAMQPHSQMVADAVPVSGHMPISGMRPVAHPDVIITNVPSSRPQALAALQNEPKKKGGLVLILGGLVTIAAMAAGVAVLVKMKGSAPVPVAVQAPVAPPVAAPVVAADPVVTDPVAATADPTPETLPVGKLAVAPKQIVASKGGGGKSAGKPAPAAPEKPVAAQEKPAAATTPAPGAPGDLNGAMQKSVGPEDQKQVQAAAPTGPDMTGMVPQKPSQGAVAGAIGAVLQNARQCLGPDDPISKALVIFGSTGAVSTVTVTGHAAGTPAEACIKTAFSKAKVSPFAEATYSANVTVRPMPGAQ